MNAILHCLTSVIPCTPTKPFLSVDRLSRLESAPGADEAASHSTPGNLVFYHIPAGEASFRPRLNSWQDPES